MAWHYTGSPAQGIRGLFGPSLLFSFRVCGGFSLGLRVPLFKGVADSLGCLAKGPVCVCVCVHVYIPPCVSIFNM